MTQFWPGLLLLLLGHLIRGSLGLPWPFCEDVLPPGQGFGGSVTITRNCLWRPQVHFVSTIFGRLNTTDGGALTVPTIALGSAYEVDTTSGPSRLVLKDLVFSNFSLSNPSRDAQVLWPRGLISPGLQPGTTLPRRLYMYDVQLLVDAGTLQQYLQFFSTPGPNATLVYTDNATFLHIPYWSDDQTMVNHVGLLLASPGGTTADLALTRPAAGRNFVLAANQATLVPVLQAAGSTSTSVPLLVYVATNISLGRPQDIAAGLPINRPVFLVGRVTVPTGIDFGMQVNQLVLLGSYSRMTLAELVLENLAPGDERSADFAGAGFDVQMGYNMWPMLYPRSSNRVALHNCTLALSTLELEEYLYKATLFKVQPAGFSEALAALDSVISSWWVSWLPDYLTVAAREQQSTAMTVLSCNYTSVQLIAERLPVPARAYGNDGSMLYHVAADGSAAHHSLTHVDSTGITGPLSSNAALPNETNEMVLLTTNMSFGAVLDSSQVVEQQLQQHLAAAAQGEPKLRHTLMGIVDPPIMLDMGYSTEFVSLGLDAAPGQLSIINMAMMHLAQGPAALVPGATVQTPEVWTHLLWSIVRPRGSATVWLSNVTLWVPAAEYSYIRSFTGHAPINFTIELYNGQALQFFNALDMRAEGVYVGWYKGPGLAGSSMRVRLDSGWVQEGSGPRGFWNMAAAQRSGRVSDAVVVVLAVCSVTAVVATVLACLAGVLWRKRSAEARLAAAAVAAAELGKAGVRPSILDGSGGQPPSQRSSSSHGREHGSGSAALLELPQEPVHDSSDSYPLQDRALLTAELARSQLLGSRPRMQDAGAAAAAGGSGEGEDGGGLRQQGLRQPPLAAAAAGGSGTVRGTVRAASDAALQRLHSAITLMSQDVLSRRLQVSQGAALPGQSSGACTAGGAGPSPLGLARDSPHSHFLQQQQLQQQQQQEGRASGSCGAAAAASDASSQSLRAQDAAGAAAGDAAEQGDATAAAAAAAAGTGQPAAAVVLQQARATSNAGSVPGHPGGNTLGELKLLQLVGQGTFGQVYKALWRRRCVAVKVLQLPASAGNSDASPWAGVGRVSSHREKMAVMETVVSTTMSHPNIVQVYTYVLQPLMSGQDGITSGNSKGQDPSCQDHQQQQAPVQQQQQQQQQEPEQQQAHSEWLQQRQQLAMQIVLGAQGAPEAAAPAATEGASLRSAEQQQQQQQQHSQLSLTDPCSGSHLHASSRHTASCNDSSQSLTALQEGRSDLSKLSPAVAAAVAAALPAASVVLLHADSTASSRHGGREGGRGSGSSSEGGDGTQHKAVLVGWELRLVMEFCDAGSLRSALDHKLLMDRTTGLPALECALFLAHDVACAMIHLHSEHLLHGDLKASNVLLKRTAPRLPVWPEQAAAAAAAAGGHARRMGQLVGVGLGLMAKVADFGLSLTLEPADTHVSQMHMGTLTHMAPELLLHGHASRASDVYAYGILLWELSTGQRPYSGTPVGMLAHKVAQQGWRPAWPGGCCAALQALTEACWAQDPGARPTFEQIVAQLEAMAGQLDALKQQQAQQMAAAAAPVCAHGSAGHPEAGEMGHELTPSMMADLMPSGFSAGSSQHEERQEADGSGTLVYEMSQLSGCSADREHHH